MQVVAASRSRRKTKRRKTPDPSFMRPEQVAELLDVSVRTLEEWRKTSKGPAFTKEGRLVRYAREDIEAWRTARRGNSTAEFKDTYRPGVVRGGR